MRYIRFYRSCNIVGSEEYEDEQFENENFPSEYDLNEMAIQKAEEAFQVDGSWEEIDEDEFGIK